MTCTSESEDFAVAPSSQVPTLIGCKFLKSGSDETQLVAAPNPCSEYAEHESAASLLREVGCGDRI